MKKIPFIILLITGALFAQPNIVQPPNLLLCSDSNTAVFDLTVTAPELLNGLNPSLYTIRYFESQTDAQNNTDEIANPTNYSNTETPQTIYARVWENADVTNFAITNFDIIVALPPDIVQPPDLIVYQYPFTGVATFDLTEVESTLLNGINPAEVSITYYETLFEAEAMVNSAPTIYTNIVANLQTMYVSVRFNDNNCVAIESFDIIVSEDVVNIPDANFLARLIANGVDTNSSGNIQSFEATAVTALTVNNANIADLTGIEAFLNIESLNCQSNQLTTLDISQNLNIEVLSCEDNQITGLDVSQNVALRILNCANNQLSTLDVSQNTDLTALRCNENQLTDLDVSSNTLMTLLRCQDNLLTDLDLSQNVNIGGLNCSDNQLTSLDLNNNIALQDFSCTNNQLTELFLKNGSIESIVDFSNNSNLAFICADEGQITTLQALADVSTVVSSFCTFTPGGDFNTITGKIIYDLNSNGCDINDMPQPHIRIDINDGADTGATFTSPNGDYRFFTEAGDFDVTPNVENPSWFDISPNTISIPFANDDNNIATQDFCITANGVRNDVEVVIAPIEFARPGFDAVYQVVYKNKGNQTLSGSVEFSYDETVLDFVSATALPDTQSNGSLIWSYNDLLPFENRSIYVTLNVNSSTDTPAINIGDQLNFNAIINPVAGDETEEDNSFEYSQTVVASYSPNSITCIQGGILPTTDIGTFLHYIINFENTGAEIAENIVIVIEVDTANFDLNTLRILNASHDVEVRIENNIVKFIFEGVNLNASGGHGNILLRVRTSGNVQSGEVVSKQADIHFDYSFPIATDDAGTVFQSLSVDEYDKDINVTIYPNPVTDKINIGSKHLMGSIEVYDAQGRIIQTIINKSIEHSFDISSYRTGIYFIKVKTEKGSAVFKVLKE